MHYNFDKVDSNFLKFEKEMLGKRPFFMRVHAPWCGHCTNMAGDWAKFSKQSKYNTVNIGEAVYKHLTDNHSERLIGKLLSDSVNGFPTLGLVSKVNNSGINFISYEGPRTAKGMQDFVKQSKL